jgi:hypothetical protein
MDTTLADIEQLAKKFADAHADLSATVAELNEAVEAVKRARLTAIKRAVERAGHHHSALYALLDRARHLFVKPRTHVFHGVKVGLQKGKGGIEFDDAEKVVALIKRHFPDQQEILIRTKETPDKDGLGTLPVADLKRLGCEVADAGDQIVIKPTDSDVDKIVSALLKEAIEEQAA